ncbi:MAG TPA: hypothetical protein VK624_18920 [Steroidobacteraceae bacterium]|nr:hypothetical protein [Steroidobacteraceae bacterium]
MLLLLSAAAIAKPLTGFQQVSLTGAVCSVGAWLLSRVFVHWDGLDLASIGANLTAGSGAGFGLGFALGLMLVGLHALALFGIGHTSLERNPSAQPAQIAYALIGFDVVWHRFTDHARSRRSHRHSRRMELRRLDAQQRWKIRRWSVEAGRGSRFRFARRGRGLGCLRCTDARTRSRILVVGPKAAAVSAMMCLGISQSIPGVG